MRLEDAVAFITVEEIEGSEGTAFGEWCRCCLGKAHCDVDVCIVEWRCAGVIEFVDLCFLDC